MPVLLIAGSRDAYGAEELAQVLPNARVVLIPGAGHSVARQAPDLFFSEIRRFLQGLH